jgi:hypothetical protein
MYSLRETITPFLKKVVAIPGVNTTQLMFGEVQSFTCWHVEDENLLSINYLHSGKHKYWIMWDIDRITAAPMAILDIANRSIHAKSTNAVRDQITDFHENLTTYWWRRYDFMV